MRILFIGDIVGKPGRNACRDNIQSLRQEMKIDFVIANGENAAGGSGLTKEIAKELFSCGIDVLTMGNHVWSKKEILQFINHETRLIRPANYPPGTPGNGYNIFCCNNVNIAVINILGRVFMTEIDCPFRKTDEILKEISDCNIIIVDFHAEATSEKIAMGWYLDGRVSAVFGTHTHVQTSDERILPEGTAYLTDAGMTGPRDSVLGVKTELIINNFLTRIPQRHEVAQQAYQFNAVYFDVDETDGKALHIDRIQNFEY